MERVMISTVEPDQWDWPSRETGLQVGEGRATRLPNAARTATLEVDSVPQEGEEDDRRPRMEMGIGIWSDERARYYPRPVVEAMDNALLDAFDGARILVYYDPTAHALGAERTDAEDASWDGEILYLSNHDRIEDGILFGEDGKRRQRDRPLQVFTRWYGFSLTFPETGIFEAPPISQE